VILVNGRLAEWHTALAEGDVVEFMPALGGG
jgi:molybdopterin converting factor small subunit